MKMFFRDHVEKAKRQLAEAQHDAMEHRLAGEHHMALAEMYKQRVLFLQGYIAEHAVTAPAATKEEVRSSFWGTETYVRPGRAA